MQLNSDKKQLLKVESDDIDNRGAFSVPNGIASIEKNAFGGCVDLKILILPNSITKIGEGAFFGCTSLQTITIPNRVIRLEDWLFYGCTSLQKVIIPNKVASIGFRAFKECTSLRLLSIPSSVTWIHSQAFEDCTNLTTIIIANDNYANILHSEIRAKAITQHLFNEVRQLQAIHLSKLTQTSQTNPLYRFFNYTNSKDNLSDLCQNRERAIEKQHGFLSQDMLRQINCFLIDDNCYYQKARALILKEPLPHSENQLKEYDKRLATIIDDCIAKANEFTQTKTNKFVPSSVSEIHRHNNACILI
ncbi:leucine-rich repeat domain-containing protein [Legionella gresilensis]|uniref:leucine-rich repeat domain-containing protein n=1 Tax=Legionella gresilensis TaxID=91823 RepID=UPI001041B275|nr:leucine-rich repeat domain-containing protein [Legionella gresilensis]